MTHGELYARYRHAYDLVERRHWHVLGLLLSGMTVVTIAGVTG